MIRRNNTKKRKEKKMTRKQLDSYVEFAELVRANISGPLKHSLIQKAQARLVERLRSSGAISSEEADDLLI
jgi:hypothetical protein